MRLEAIGLVAYSLPEIIKIGSCL